MINFSTMRINALCGSLLVRARSSNSEPTTGLLESDKDASILFPGEKLSAPSSFALPMPNPRLEQMMDVQRLEYFDGAACVFVTVQSVSDGVVVAWMSATLDSGEPLEPPIGNCYQTRDGRTLTPRPMPEEGMLVVATTRDGRGPFLGKRVGYAIVSSATPSSSIPFTVVERWQPSRATGEAIAPKLESSR